jgi:hypothetical protein
MARSGEQVRGWCARRSLERGGPHPRWRSALERGRARPRWRLALERGGPRPRGRSALERGETSPEGATGPRARQSFVSAVLRPSSKAGFRLRVPEPIVLVGRWGYWGHDYVVCVLGLRICLCFRFLRNKMGFPSFLGDPYGCPRQWPLSICGGIR